MKKHLLLALSVVFLMVSCSKPTNQTKGVPEMLRTGKWKMASAKVKLRLPSGLDTILNMFNFMPSCKTGVYLSFDTGFTGNMFTGTPCNPSDPTNIYFQWQFSNNNTILHLYDGFNLVYAITDTIQALYFDTLVNNPNVSPSLVLDSIVTAEDTAFHDIYPNFIVLDSMWNLKFDSIPDPYTDVYAQISNFSQTSFTMTFAEITNYPDSTHNHATWPVYRPDTAHFTIVFNNF